MSQPNDRTATVTDQVAERAGDVKERATDAVVAGRAGVEEVTHTATEQAREVAQEAARQARDLLGEARDQVGSQANDQREKLVSSLRALSEEFGAMARRDEQGGLAAELVGQAHDRLQGVVGWMENKQPGDLLQDVRSFARNRPGAFLVGAALAGVAAGRLTRGAVSAHTEQSEQSEQSPASPPNPLLSTPPPPAPSPTPSLHSTTDATETTVLPSVPHATADPATGYQPTTPRGAGFPGASS